MALHQGSMLVTEYCIRFTQLLRFAKDAFPSEEMVKNRFENGLRNNIKVQLSTVHTTSVAECAELAMAFER